VYNELKVLRKWILFLKIKNLNETQFNQIFMMKFTGIWIK